MKFTKTIYKKLRNSKKYFQDTFQIAKKFATLFLKSVHNFKTSSKFFGLASLGHIIYRYFKQTHTFQQGRRDSINLQLGTSLDRYSET